MNVRAEKRVERAKYFRNTEPIPTRPKPKGGNFIQTCRILPRVLSVETVREADFVRTIFTLFAVVGTNDWPFRSRRANRRGGGEKAGRHKARSTRVPKIENFYFLRLNVGRNHAANTIIINTVRTSVIENYRWWGRPGGIHFVGKTERSPTKPSGDLRESDGPKFTNVGPSAFVQQPNASAGAGPRIRLPSFGSASGLFGGDVKSRDRYRRTRPVGDYSAVRTIILRRTEVTATDDSGAYKPKLSLSVVDGRDK